MLYIFKNMSTEYISFYYRKEFVCVDMYLPKTSNLSSPSQSTYIYTYVYTTKYLYTPTCHPVLYNLLKNFNQSSFREIEEL